MAIYRSELSAIVCGVNAGMTPIVAIQSWQGQYKSGFVEDLTKRHSDTEKLNAIDKLAQDSIARARIKRNAKWECFCALVAKYSADEAERANAVNELVKLCDIKCTEEGKRLLIWLWAVEGKQRRGIIEQVMDFFNQVSRSTFFRRKKEIFIWLDDLESLIRSEARDVLGSML